LGDDDARQRHLAGLGDCFAQDGIDIAAGIAVGRQVVGGVVINRSDGIGIRDRVVVEAGAVFSLSCSCCVTLHAVGPLIDPSP
jgi:hypothetical protein